MNKTTIYEQLQHHYQKLQTRLAKARNKGRSQTFQERLWGRIQRCSLQMKQLGAGVAVIAALGVSTPVLGQATDTLPLNYIECTGADNPFDTIAVRDIPKTIRDISFVDLDGDGDQDMLLTIQDYDINSYSYVAYLSYRENIGSSANPQYGTAISNTAFDSVVVTTNMENFTFADIDGDGDQDMIGSIVMHSTSNAALNYYENTGSSSNAIFIPRTGANNPFEGVVNYVNGLSLPGIPVLHPTFVDIDGDNDQDFFIATSLINSSWPNSNNSDRLLYYQNTPTGFVKQTGANNPLEIVNASLINGAYIKKELKFADFDRQKDGDLDVVFFSNMLTGLGYSHFKNIGTATAPSFAATNDNVLDTVFVKYNIFTSPVPVKEIVDLDNDGRAEIVLFNNADIRYFKEMSTTIGLNKLLEPNSLIIHPNPSTGIFQLEESYTGQLEVYTTTGQMVYSQQVQEVEQLDLQHLDTGIYIVSLQTAKKRLVQQLTIIK